MVPNYFLMQKNTATCLGDWIDLKESNLDQSCSCLLLNRFNIIISVILLVSAVRSSIDTTEEHVVHDDNNKILHPAS